MENKSKAELQNEITRLKQQLTLLQASEDQYKQAKVTMWESQARIATILDTTNEAIITIDETQRIILFNKGAERIFGYAADEIIGQPLSVLLPDRFKERHETHIEEFSQSLQPARLMAERQEIFGRRKDGREFPAEASISKFDAGGARILTAVLRDITDRKQVERAREQLINELRALNEAARTISAELSREDVLQKIAEAARTLVKVNYAALGVHDGQGQLSQFITAGISAEDKERIGPLPIGRGLLGLLFFQGESMIINDIASHAGSVGFPEHHPVMHTLLGVPIFSKGELIGGLYLSDKQEGGDFTETDRQLVEMLALQAAIAIENSSLYEQTQRLAIYEERERFARDLHDGIIQSIYAVGLMLDQIKLDMGAVNQGTAGQIDLSLQSLASVIQDLRNYIFDLRPQALKYQGLRARLEGLIKELRVNTLLPIDATITQDIDRFLSDIQARHIFHISHEALANAVRHAQASKISLSLTKEENTITLTISDDGVGFSAKKPDLRPGHRGLANMRARATEMGARLNIDAAPDQGTKLSLSFRSIATDGGD